MTVMSGSSCDIPVRSLDPKGKRESNPYSQGFPDVIAFPFDFDIWYNLFTTGPLGWGIIRNSELHAGLSPADGPKM